MIKGRGCREDVEGKGDGQAMVVHCCPALVLCVIASSVSVLHVIMSALHHFPMWSCVVITSSHGCAVASSYHCPVSLSCLSARWAGKKVGRGCLPCCFKIRSDDE